MFRKRLGNQLSQLVEDSERAPGPPKREAFRRSVRTSERQNGEALATFFAWIIPRCWLFEDSKMMLEMIFLIDKEPVNHFNFHIHVQGS
jgi:hypothetical protein